MLPEEQQPEEQYFLGLQFPATKLVPAESGSALIRVPANAEEGEISQRFEENSAHIEDSLPLRSSLNEPERNFLPSVQVSVSGVGLRTRAQQSSSKSRDKGSTRDADVSVGAQRQQKGKRLLSAKRNWRRRRSRLKRKRKRRVWSP